MKINVLFRIGLLLIVIGFLFTPAFGQDDLLNDCPETVSIPFCSCTSNPQQSPVVYDPGSNLFTINCLPDSTTASKGCQTGLAESGCYKLFWDFGDGTYACGLTDEAAGTMEHVYYDDGSGGGQTATFIAVKIYTKNKRGTNVPVCDGDSTLYDVLDEIEINVPASGTQQVPPSPSLNLDNNCIKANPIYQPHRGEDSWIAIGFYSYGSGQTINFHFDPGIFTYQNDFLFNAGPGQNAILLPTCDLTNGDLCWEVSGLEPGKKHYILVKLRVFSNAPNSPIAFYTETLPSPSDGEGEVFCDQNTHNYYSPKGVGPKDPNAKYVDSLAITSREPVDLNYSIFFYNIGNGQAEKVTVIDTISDKLDLCYFKMDSALINGQMHYDPCAKPNKTWLCPEIDYQERTVEWVFEHPTQNNWILNGLYQIDQGYNTPNPPPGLFLMPHEEVATIVDNTTSMELFFSIKTNCDFKYWDTVDNQARIQFNNLEWFTTSPARTVKVCCDTSLATTIPNDSALSLFNDIFNQINPGLPPYLFDQPTITFNSGAVTFIPGPGPGAIFSYDSTFTGPDFVTFGYFFSNGEYHTETIHLCVYEKNNPPTTTCQNTPCTNVPVANCPPPPPPPPTPIPWWYYAIGIAVILLAVAIQRIWKKSA